jgi:hypothetical protein
LIIKKEENFYAHFLSPEFAPFYIFFGGII